MTIKIKKITKKGADLSKPVKKSQKVTKKKPIEKKYKINLNEKAPESYKENMNDVLIYFDNKYNGNWDDIYGAILRKEKVDKDDLYRTTKRLKEEVDYTTLIDDDYPDHLKYQYKPPFLLKRKKKK